MIKRRRKTADASPAGRNSTLAVTVATRRGQLGLTQATLARNAGVAERTVRNVEAGRMPHARVLAALAAALEVDAAELRRTGEAVSS